MTTRLTILLAIRRPLAFVFLFALLSLAFWLAWPGLLLALADARGRCKEAARYIRERRPAHRRILEKSWCGRGILTAVEPDYKDPHPLRLWPDGAPRIFFKPAFWRAVISS